MCFSKTPSAVAHGDARPFDAELPTARFWARGSALLVLKRLDEASSDGDRRIFAASPPTPISRGRMWCFSISICPGSVVTRSFAIVKTDPELRRIPIVVLTTSEAEEDIVRSYDHHANAYVTKPVGFDSFLEVVRQIDEFFISVVRLPAH